ncbi:RING-H2 finger protein [Nymphaea thermarum]|nr:RING-H2 finger protein [Nymphaea thermarum]
MLAKSSNKFLNSPYSFFSFAHSMELISGARLSRRLLAEPAASTGGSGGEPPNGAMNLDVVVILAALLCTLICLVGWGFMTHLLVPLRRQQGPQAKSHPRYSRWAFDARADKSTDCAICLSEFLTGEQVRVLPLCAHCFRPSCIDIWLSSHPSCPSCRRFLLTRKAAAPPPPPSPLPPTVRVAKGAGCQRIVLRHPPTTPPPVAPYVVSTKSQLQRRCATYT